MKCNPLMTHIQSTTLFKRYFFFTQISEIFLGDGCMVGWLVYELFLRGISPAALLARRALGGVGVPPGRWE